MTPAAPPWQLSELEFHAARQRERGAGLLGYVAVTLDGRLRLSGLTVRRTRQGRLCISFPARRDGAGRERPYFRPVDDRTRRSFEEAVFAALGLAEGPA